MKRKRVSILIFWCLIISIPSTLLAEKVSLRLSYNVGSYRNGDINTWVESFNNLWNDWQAKNGGQLTGQFDKIKYDPSYELELRIPLYKGFALNISGTYLKTSKNGTVDFSIPTSSQTESMFILNKVTAIPIKIGFSFDFPLPVYPRLIFFAGLGRHIVFTQYKTEEKYNYSVVSYGEEFNYWYERANTFRSEALGFYASGGIEFRVFPFVAVVMEAEQVWTKVDGFKGPFTSDTFDNKDLKHESGKASLYYYESDVFGLNKFYPVLAGHRVTPEGENTQNLRPGQLNFSGMTFKFGIKFVF